MQPGVAAAGEHSCRDGTAPAAAAVVAPAAVARHAERGAGPSRCASCRASAPGQPAGRHGADADRGRSLQPRRPGGCRAGGLVVFKASGPPGSRCATAVARCRCAPAARRERGRLRQPAAAGDHRQRQRTAVGVRGQPVDLGALTRDNIADASRCPDLEAKSRPEAPPTHPPRDISTGRRAAPVAPGARGLGDHVVTVGGDAPVRVQSMTNTDTVDVIGTAIQVKELARPAANWCASRSTRPRRRSRCRTSASSSTAWACAVPLIGDFHYNGHRLLTEFPACARGAVQVPHQPRQRRQGRQARPPVRPDDRGGAAARQAGAHRRELGQPRPGTAGRADGRERAPRAALGRASR